MQTRIEDLELNLDGIELLVKTLKKYKKKFLYIPIYSLNTEFHSNEFSL